jgi:hypothetical protein
MNLEPVTQEVSHKAEVMSPMKQWVQPLSKVLKEILMK